MADGGDVQTGGNRSVHWRVTARGRSVQRDAKISSPRLAKGVVTVPGGRGNIGKNVLAPEGQKGFFVVTLRFKNLQQAQTELAKTIHNLSSRGNGVFARVRVPAILRDKPTDDLPWEVKVAW